MTGVKAPAAVLGASVVATHAAKGTLPFTGIALGTYLGVGAGLVLSGLVLRVVARTRDNT
jgi:hypothetical protein